MTIGKDVTQRLDEDIRKLGYEVDKHSIEIENISSSLLEIKYLISQIRWFITGGVFFLAADKLGFFTALTLGA